jgi:hypothetical protein
MCNLIKTAARDGAGTYLTALGTTLHYKPENTIACPGNEQTNLVLLPRGTGCTDDTQREHPKSIVQKT